MFQQKVLVWGKATKQTELPKVEQKRWASNGSGMIYKRSTGLFCHLPE